LETANWQTPPCMTIHKPEKIYMAATKLGSRYSIHRKYLKLEKSSPSRPSGNELLKCGGSHDLDLLQSSFCYIVNTFRSLCTQHFRKIENKASKQPLMVNDWGDFICGGPWPSDKPLNTPRGPQDHFVSLWYRHGKPCMGRAWNSAGKIDASFVDGGREFTGHVIGSMQMLVEVPATAAGFDYCWLPYEQASRYMDKDFAPVHLSYIAPCVVQVDAFELLGTILLLIALRGPIYSLLKF
uniref:Peptidylprolyl isomerase n=1 Tax=Heligmosomoides polygyrus TaxID=6339 RepID=A0A183GER9_HELPZ